MPGWLAPVIGGLLGTAGEMISGNSNRKWQQRMSSTSYQRAVADLRAAGLNPALAYSQGGASTPTAMMGNPATAGASSASAVNAMQIARESMKADIRLKEAQAQTARDTGYREHWQGRLNERAFRFENALEPYQLRQSAAEALLQEALIPGARKKSAIEGVKADLTESAVRSLRQGVSSARKWARDNKVFDPETYYGNPFRRRNR